MKLARHSAAMLAIALFLGALSGCGGLEALEASPPPESRGAAFVPSFAENRFDAPQQVTPGIWVDFSTTPAGYIGLRVENDHKMVAQLKFGESAYNYHLPAGDGSVWYLPINSGDGSYTLRVLQNTTGSKYIELWSGQTQVALENSYGPWLHSNYFVHYTAGSDCVALAQRLAADAEDEMDYVAAVYDYICDNIDYDYQLAETVQDGYRPDPDRTLSLGTGICFDYASLAAAIFRSQGIPARLITGYVGDDALYHAWNEIYLEGAGWISVEIRVNAAGWKRLDFTALANGITGENNQYVDRYIY